MALLNAKQQHEEIKSAALTAIQGLFPVEKNKHKLVLKRVWVEDKLNDLDYKKQAEIKNKEGTWGVKVLADLDLVNIASGEVIDSQKKIRLLVLPKMTDRFSYLVKGNEYQVTNQLRLKSGAYVKKTKSGEVKTQFNMAKGRDAELKVSAKGVINMHVGSTKIPLYPLLKGMGVSESQMKSVWGDDVLKQNQDTKVSSSFALRKLASSLASVKTNDPETAKDSIKSYIKDKTEIYPDMTKFTLGKKFTTFSPDLWLTASGKLVDVIRGDKEPDDVDNLAFKSLVTVEDSIKERIEKNKGDLLRKIKRNLDSRDKIRQIINLSTLGNTVESFFTNDERSNVTEQINPLHMYSGRERVTFLGPGAITNLRMVTDDTRNVHPTHLSYIDPVHTPESEKIGVNLGLTIGASKKGDNIASAFYDVKAKKYVNQTPMESYDKNIAFPEEWDNKTKKFKNKRVRVQHKGKIKTVPVNEVDLVIPSAQSAFTLSTNMIPFLANDNGNRTMMAGKHMEQAIGLKDREQPLVQTKVPWKDDTFEKALGNSLVAAQKAQMDGEVVRVGKDSITIKSGRNKQEVPLYNDFNLNQKTYLNHTPIVKLGDKVKKGQILAESNFTKDGVLALGKNLRVGYVPYKGYNFEDGIVITDTAAKKLTSEHLTKIQSEIDSKTVTSLPKFVANFPNEINTKNRAKLDESGVIKKGSKVELGDILVAHMTATLAQGRVENIKGRFGKKLPRTFLKNTVEWKEEFPAEVVNVIKDSNKVLVFLKSLQPAVIGDKLAGRHGNKGIITKIIPDAHAPKDISGEPVEILLNPHGVISRINVGQIYESAAAKAAKKTGKIKEVVNFEEGNTLEKIKQELKAAGVSDEEELFDGLSGKSLGKVHVGNPYILKLEKQSGVNFSVRGEGGPTTKAAEQPISGGEEGGKSLDPLTMYTMLSHGSRANLKDMNVYKSENNPELWEAIKYGRNLPAPKSTYAFNKFLDMLKASGVDVKKEGSKYQLGPLTDAQTESMSSMEIKKPLFVTAKGAKRTIEKDGFLDEKGLGGPEGTKWGHIEMKEKTVNPMFGKAVASLTHVPEKQLLSVISGKQNIHVDGKDYTGIEAIEKRLNQINVSEDANALEKELPNLKGAKLNHALRKYRILKSLEKLNMKPTEAYLRKKIPVIPPKMRRVDQLDNGTLVADDVNDLYKNVSLINTMMKQPVVDLLPEDEMAEVREELNKNIAALSGLETVKVGARERSGFMSAIKGDAPKHGFYQGKVLKKQQNLVGRATIIPEPKLHMDEASLPELMAWKLYSPFVIKRLVSLGLSALEARQSVENRSLSAKKALEHVMRERPVILNRAPSLHKFSIMAFRPKITHGKAIKIPPLVTHGFNADFDGDAMTAHIPITDKSVREAYKMMPSRNLYKPGTGALMVGPSQESQLGFYLLTKSEEGRKRLNKLLPTKYKINTTLDKNTSKALFVKLSKELSNEDFSRIIDEIKVMGENEAYEQGFSLALKDIELLPSRGKILTSLNNTVEKYLDGKISEEKFTKLVSGKGGYNDFTDMQISSHLKNKDNSFYEMVNSGARGNKSQLRQILASPLIVQDPSGKLIPKPIEKSYAEGLSLSDYWASSYGARKGMMDRALSTEEPGVFNKSLMAATIDNVVSMEDCGTRDGISFPINSPEILGRFTQGIHGPVPNKSLIKEKELSLMKKAGIKSVRVRSPLKCEASKGTCRTCFGVDENGEVAQIGENLGAKTGQAISEPMQQMVMNTFHTGGVAGSGTQSGKDRVNLLLEMPKKMKFSQATLASIDGTVNNIVPSGLGGYNVFINNVKHVTLPKKKLRVKIGSKVKKGDMLSEGVISPRELLKYKGVEATQEYMTDGLQEAYLSQKMPIERKTFETVIRSITNRTKVKNNPAHADYLPGDSITLTEANNYNKHRKFVSSVDEAEGYLNASDLGYLKKGDRLTKKDVSLLKGMGIKDIKVEKDKLEHEPYVEGFTYLPNQGQDWLARMGARKLQDSVIEAASQGWASDVKSYHPIPAYAFGASFGEGEEGRY